MKEITITKYKCAICGACYDTPEAAHECEKQPVTHDDVEIGEEVLITQGAGKGFTLTVENKTVLSKDWGHYQRKRYWHTVAVTGPVKSSHGHRMLTFDSRQKISDK